MKAFGSTSSEELRSQSITILKLHENVILTSHNCYINQLHIIINQATKYESYQTNDHREIAITM